VAAGNRNPLQLCNYTAADLEALESSREQMHSTYVENSSFHVMVTSYRLVLINAVYFQGIHWKFVTLDDVKISNDSEKKQVSINKPWKSRRIGAFM
jgi:hypothetical protein